MSSSVLNTRIPLGSPDVAYEGDWTGWHTGDPSASVSLSVSGATTAYLHGDFSGAMNAECRYSVTLDAQDSTHLPPSSSPTQSSVLFAAGQLSSGPHRITLHDISPACGVLHLTMPVITIPDASASSPLLLRRDASTGTSSATSSQQHGLSTGAIIGLSVGLPIGAIFVFKRVQAHRQLLAARAALADREPAIPRTTGEELDVQRLPNLLVPPSAVLRDDDADDMPPPMYERLDSVTNASSSNALGAHATYAPPSGLPPAHAAGSRSLAPPLTELSSRMLSWGSVPPSSPSKPEAAFRKL